jgi:hypothetical protein
MNKYDNKERNRTRYPLQHSLMLYRPKLTSRLVHTYITQSNNPNFGLKILPHREVRTSLALPTETRNHNLEYQPKQNSEVVDKPGASREVTYTAITLLVRALGEWRGRMAQGADE